MKDAYVAREKEKIITEARKQWLEEEIEKVLAVRKDVQWPEDEVVFGLGHYPQYYFTKGKNDTVNKLVSRLEAELKALNK